MLSIFNTKFKLQFILENCFPWFLNKILAEMNIARLEIDIKRLLSVCEDMAQNNSTDDWRLSKV